MIREQHYPYIGITTLIVIIIIIIGGYYAWKKFSKTAETFESQVTNLDAYKLPSKQLDDNILTFENPENPLVPSPNYDSTTWIGNNISDYAYLADLSQPSTIPVGPQEVPISIPVTTTPSMVPFDKREQPILQTPSDSFLIDDGANGTLKLDYNQCSKSCCATNVWPVPFYVPEEEGVKGKDYVPTNMFCTNSISNGCLCATPKQITNLRTRGGNSPYFY